MHELWRMDEHANAREHGSKEASAQELMEAQDLNPYKGKVLFEPALQQVPVKSKTSDD